MGEPAPDFTGTDTNGKAVRLADFKGKFVVLEWYNHECPFVGKHYGSGNMQRLQKEWTGEGRRLADDDSSAPGKQGYVDGREGERADEEQSAAPTAVLLDPEGHGRPRCTARRRRRTCS